MTDQEEGVVTRFIVSRVFVMLLCFCLLFFVVVIIQGTIGVLCYHQQESRCGPVGRAPRSGRGSRGFESHHLDHCRAGTHELEKVWEICLYGVMAGFSIFCGLVQLLGCLICCLLAVLVLQ